MPKNKNYKKMYKVLANGRTPYESYGSFDFSEKGKKRAEDHLRDCKSFYPTVSFIIKEE